MTIYLKQSTASQEIPLGPFVDDADGDTAQTALTIANTDIKIWKTGATTLADKNSGGATHISGGIYYAVLDATDTNTLGPMVIFVHHADALAVRVECCVLAANVYDSLIGGGDTLQVDVSQFGNTNGTFSSGRPEVNTTHWGGTAVASATVNANATQISGDSTAADNLEALFDGTGYAIPGLFARVNTATAGAAGSITLDGSAPTTAEIYRGQIVTIISGTGAGQSRIISAYSTGRVATVNPNWQVNPDNTSVFAIFMPGSVNLQNWRYVQPNSLIASAYVPSSVESVSNNTTAADNMQLFFDGTGYAGGTTKLEVNLVSVNGAAQTATLDTIKSDTGAILEDTGTDGVVVAAGSKTGYRLSATGVDDVLDEAVEGGYTFRQALRIFLSVLGGKLSGAATATNTFRDVNDSKDRVTATVDADGNRTAITIDVT